MVSRSCILCLLGVVALLSVVAVAQDEEVFFHTELFAQEDVAEDNNENETDSSSQSQTSQQSQGSQSAEQSTAAESSSAKQKTAPTVNISAISGKVNPSDDVTLYGSATATTSGATIASYLWSCNKLPLNSSQIDGGVKTASILTILAGTLKAGTSYTFTLNATDSNGLTGTASITFLVNSPPHGGNWSVSPLSGYGVTTMFNFTAGDDWEDDSEDTPFKYSFFSVSSSGVETALSSRSTSRNALVFLPMPSTNASTVTVVMHIFDKWGAEAIAASHSITLYKQTLSSSQITNAVANALSLLNTTGDVSAATSAISSIASSLETSSGNTSERTALRSLIVDATATLLSAVSSLSDEQFEIFSSTLSTITSAPAELTQTAVDSALGIITSLLNIGLAQDGITESTFALLQSSLDNTLVFTSDSSSSNASAFEEKLDSLATKLLRAGLLAKPCSSSPLSAASSNLKQVGFHGCSAIPSTANQNMGNGMVTVFSSDLLDDASSKKRVAPSDYQIQMFARYLTTESSAASLQDVYSHVMTVTALDTNGAVIEVPTIASGISLTFPIVKALGTGYTATCVYYNSSNKWSTSGCTVTQANSTSVVCKCTHLSKFSIGRAAVVVAASSQQSSSSTGTVPVVSDDDGGNGVNLAVAIAIPVVLGCVLIVAIVIAVVVVKMKRKNTKVAQGDY